LILLPLLYGEICFGKEGRDKIYNTMKIIIFNDELRSQMQMYLALHRRHEVEIAEDENALIELLDQTRADITFVDLNYATGENNGETGIKLVKQVRRKYPNLRLIGIHDGQNPKLQDKAKKLGIADLITRPIRNRELLKAIGQ